LEINNGLAESMGNLTITVPAGPSVDNDGLLSSQLNDLTVSGTITINNGTHDLVNSGQTLTTNALVMNGTAGAGNQDHRPNRTNSGNSIINIGAGA